MMIKLNTCVQILSINFRKFIVYFVILPKIDVHLKNKTLI